MFKRLAVPLHVTTFSLDGTVKEELDVNEPLVAGGNIAINGGKPAIVYQNGGGGDTPIATTTWVSRTSSYQKGTVVTDVETGESYKVIEGTPMRSANLTYYELQDNNDSDINQGGDDSVSTDSGHPADWY